MLWNCSSTTKTLTPAVHLQTVQVSSRYKTSASTKFTWDVKRRWVARSVVLLDPKNQYWSRSNPCNNSAAPGRVLVKFWLGRSRSTRQGVLLSSCHTPSCLLQQKVCLPFTGVSIWWGIGTVFLQEQSYAAGSKGEGWGRSQVLWLKIWSLF